MRSTDHQAEAMHAGSSSSPAAAYDWRRGLACGSVAVLIGLTQSLGLSLVSSNLAAIQGSLQATLAEANLLVAAYIASAISASLLLAKLRFHYGLRRFASTALCVFLLISALHLLTDNLASAIAARAALGFAAAALTTLSFLYTLEAFPKHLTEAAVLLGFGSVQLGIPLSRVLATDLLEIGQWHGLFLVDVALATLSLAAIQAVSLTPVPRQQSFSRGDIPVFALYVAGLALLSVALAQGRIGWWTDSKWIGASLAGAIALLGLYAVVDLRRTKPLIDLRWAASPWMVNYFFAVLFFRMTLSEQTVGIVGLMNALGQGNDQMRVLFALATAGTVAGFVISVALVRMVHPRAPGIVATLLIALAAGMDSTSTSLTRPVDLHVSQTLMAAALAMFFSAASLLGLGRVVKEGGQQVVSFLAAFSLALYLGTLLGSAAIGTVVEERRQWHYAVLAEDAASTNPWVKARAAQLATGLSGIVADPAERSLAATAQFSQQANREATVLAYDDVFRDVAAVAVAMFVWLGLVAWLSRTHAQAASPVPGASSP